jgi:hypothetical protein
MLLFTGKSSFSRAIFRGATLRINVFFWLIVALLFICLLFLPACDLETTNPVENDNDDCPAEQWDYDTGGGYAYRHDCNPYEGNHFTIYSDGSTMGAKQQLAGLAENTFTELVTDFQIQNIEEELQFISGYTYYIYAEKHIPDIKAMGYRNGFFIAAIDCATIPNPYNRNPPFYKYLLKHELTHVFQFTLTNCPRNSSCPDWLGVWFREGQAVFMGEHPGGLIIESLGEYQNWVADPDHINPIQIYRWTDFPNPDIAGEYYPMFGLAYKYLIDTIHGHGASMTDMRELFQFMKEGDSFEAAFERALGISVELYRENFFTLMEQYFTNSG